MVFKLDLKDKKILREFIVNPNISLSRISKNIGLSQQNVDYRLKNLFRKKIILSVVSCIDLTRLGFIPFRIHIRFKSISEEKKKNFEKFIFENYKCLYMGSVGGRWDHYFDIFAESILDFQNNISEILDKFSEEVQDYETFTIVSAHVFNYKYISDDVNPDEFVLLNSNANFEIDSIDSEILKIVKKNSLTPYSKIGLDVGLTRNAVKARINKLKEKGVIVKERMFLNPNSIGMESYKILLKLGCDAEERKKLIQFARVHKNIIYTLELMGSYDMDLEIEIKNREELQKLIIQLRNNFKIIKEYEIMPLFYDFVSDFYPIEK